MNHANARALESLKDGLSSIFDRNTRRLESYANDVPHDLIDVEGHMHDRIAEVLGNIRLLQHACDDFDSDTLEDLQTSAKHAETMNRRLCQLVADMYPIKIKERIVEEACPMALKTLTGDYHALNALSNQSQSIYDAELQALNEQTRPAPVPVRRLALVHSAQ